MGGARHSSTLTAADWPQWLQPYAQSLGEQAYNLLTPGGQVGQMPAALNQQVAPFQPYQQQGISDIAGSAGAQQAEVGALRGSVADTLSGKYLDPSTNPYLRATYDQAAQGMRDQYALGAAPALASQARQAGAFGGSSYDQARDVQQYGFGKNLSDLATNIYGGNYQQERGRQLAEQSQVPGLMQAETQPGQTLLGVGGLQQQQQQQQMDVGTQNAIRQFQFPQGQLEELGQLLGLSRGPGGVGTTITPNRAGSLKIFLYFVFTPAMLLIAGIC